MRIRPATTDDLAAIAGVQTASWRDAYAGILPDDYLRNEVGDDLRQHWLATDIRGDDVVLVAETDGIIGFIAVWCRPEPYIDNLHVLPARRSGGIGRELMAAAAERLIRSGHTTACLWVFEENRRAIGFYERLGGVQVERARVAFHGHSPWSIKIAWSDLAVLT